MTKVMWVTWQEHRRTESLCRELNIEPHVLKTTKSGLFRYLSLVFSTIKVLSQARPNTLFVQNPSIVLSLLAVLLKPIFRYQLLVDAHNEGVLPFVNDNAIFRFITKLIHRFSDFTIVTNDGMAEIIIKNSGTPAVLPDALPTPEVELSKIKQQDKFTVVLISTYAKDEPIKEVLMASQTLNNVQLVVTGNYKKAKFDVAKYPECHFTGFLSEKDYWYQLASADLIIDLTTMKDCLVCGSYEAIALSKPLLLSDDNSAKRLFPKGVTFTKNNTNAIQLAISEIINDYCNKEKEMKKLTVEYKVHWQVLFQELLNKLRE